jgi:hypothetical protein
MMYVLKKEAGVSFSPDFVGASGGVRDGPVPVYKLYGAAALIADADAVCEKVLLPRGVAPLHHVTALNPDPDVL